MKLSYAISLHDTGFNSIAKGKWIDKIRIMSDLGYNGVELSIRNPEETNVAYIEKILNCYKLDLSAIGTGQLFVDDGLSLSSLKRDLRIKTVNHIKKHIDIARIFGSQVIIGLVRGRRINLTDSNRRCYRNFICSFRQICDYANKQNVAICIEPINRYETDFLNRADEVIGFIGIFKCKFLKVLLDTFHMNIEEKNIVDSILKTRHFLSHMHIADSNRRCPGEGHLDFLKIIKTLKKINYRGFLSGEILPYPNSKMAIRNYIKFLRGIVNE